MTWHFEAEEGNSGVGLDYSIRHRTAPLCFGWAKTRRDGEVTGRDFQGRGCARDQRMRRMRRQSWTHQDTSLCHNKRTVVSLEVEELVGDVFGGERVE